MNEIVKRLRDQVEDRGLSPVLDREVDAWGFGTLGVDFVDGDGLWWTSTERLPDVMGVPVAEIHAELDRIGGDYVEADSLRWISGVAVFGLMGLIGPWAEEFRENMRPALDAMLAGVEAEPEDVDRAFAGPAGALRNGR